MDGMNGFAQGLPYALEDLESHGPRATAELWLMARLYSRLRHRTSPRKRPLERLRFESLKTHCIRLALERDPSRFLVFVDPGFPHLRLIYHRDERNLLHLPLTTDLGVTCDRDGP